MSERARRALLHAITATVVFNVPLTYVPDYRHEVLRTREAILRDDLRFMRKMIDQFTVDKERAPAFLEELVGAGYLPEIPIDPMTYAADTWVVVLEDESVAVSGKPGILDVKSGSDDLDSSGTRRYSDW